MTSISRTVSLPFMLLLARWIIPVSHPPIENGAVLVEKERIQFVGPREAAPQKAGPVVDLGDSLLLPGLVNAHGHLELSALKGKVPPADSFTQWVKEVTHQKALLTREDVRKGMNNGIASLLQGGTTTLADHCHPGSLWLATPLRRIPFWEVLGAHPQRAREALGKARQRAVQEGGFISPHSLYAVHEEILEEIFNPPQSLRSIHVLESDDENLFFRKQTGPLAVYVQERGGDLSFPVSSPVKWLAANHWLKHGTLLVHGNHLIEEEMDLLASSGAGVVHCPGSHAFFRHRRFPLEELHKKGVPIALGTDSLASNEDLSMLREMRILKENYPVLSNEEILRMATLEGAKLLGMDDRIGSLEVGKKADLIAVKMEPGTSDPLESILQAPEVSLSMIGGRQAF